MQFLVISAIISIAGAYLWSDPEEKEAIKYVNHDDVNRMRMAMVEQGTGYGTEWIWMPDGNEVPRMAILKKTSGSAKLFGFSDEDNSVTEEKEDESEYNMTENVIFRLYTRNDRKRGEIINPDNKDSIMKSNFNPSNPTKMIIHGWMSSEDSSTVQNIKSAYLKKSDVNVIGVDWSNIASNTYYFTPASETANVGKHVGKMIDALAENRGAKYEDFHIIGHSLGAHVAGAAGSASKKKIARVTGLDPALPGFQYFQIPEGRLDDSDAEFVQVIHTCAGALGMSSPAGHADFYPNGGSPFQPGCCCLPEFTESCSHGRAHHYFAESIEDKSVFEAASCATWDHFKRGVCSEQMVRMGEYTPTKTRGIYYLVTNASSPFALGTVGSKYFEQD